MERKVVEIADNGEVLLPKSALMSVCELSVLFEASSSAIVSNIRAIEKSEVAVGDYSRGCVVTPSGNVVPDFYGVDVAVALAFRLNTRKAYLLRNWVLRRATQPEVRLPEVQLVLNSKKQIVH